MHIYILYVRMLSIGITVTRQQENIKKGKRFILTINIRILYDNDDKKKGVNRFKRHNTLLHAQIDE